MDRVNTVAPQATPALIQPHAERLVAANGPRVAVVRARPRWNGGDLTVAGRRVLVRPAVSQLAALEALAERGPNDYLVLLSDRPDADLGDVVLTDTGGRGAESLDEWAAVPPMFGAQTVDPALRRLTWAPLALLEHRPAGGWPPATTGVVTADHAIGNLLGAALGMRLPVDLDLMVVMSALDEPAGRAAWHDTPEKLRRTLIDWARDRHGSPTAMVLAAATRGRVSVVALGLVLDVLWPESGAATVDPDQGAARGRIESHVDGRALRAPDARVLAGVARTLALRLDATGDPALGAALAQAEALLCDIGWEEGAERSSILPAGLTARLRAFAALLQPPDGADIAARLPRIEGAFEDVIEHLLARVGDPSVEAAHAAVRLARWLAGGPGELPLDLGAALRDYLDDGAWVDRAVAALWDATADVVVAGAYRELIGQVQRLRGLRDQHAAELLATATERDEPPAGATLIERALTDLVVPVARHTPVLVVLLDGMSAAVATQLAETVVDMQWVEVVPASSSRRVPLLAALPTSTEFSRTAFFTGEIREGRADAETSAMRKRFDAPLFHKNDLRSPAGDALAAEVRSALDDPEKPIVAVVLNTIDDMLHNVEATAPRWTVDAIAHLRTLLSAAAMAGRAVVLTSDHGHVIERGGEARPVGGADARSRPLSSGPAGPGEVVLRGRRVASGEVVLPWREDLRYSSRATGYHGGASLAELTVPFTTFVRGDVPRGWVAAPPQAPAWWNETRREEPAVSGGRRARRSTVAGATVDLARPGRADGTPTGQRHVPSDDGPQGVLPFEVPTTAVPGGDPGEGQRTADALLGSDVYAAQRTRAGRRALPDEAVGVVVRELVDNGWRAHRDTVAALLGVPLSRFQPTLAALARLLNVEGYQVISLDADGVTVRLDRDLLADQFDLGGRRG